MAARSPPGTKYAWVGRASSKRALWQLAVTEAARCTVEQLMKVNGWRGATRAKKPRAAVSDRAADRAPELVNRQFAVEAPNRLLVVAFTYVQLAAGAFAYTAFVIDAFTSSIAGWDCSLSKHTTFVERAIRPAAELRLREGNLCQTRRLTTRTQGRKYTSLLFTETLQLHGLSPSIGTVGDAYDNALAETTIGRHKAACIRLPLSLRATDRPQQARGHHRRLGPLVQPQSAHAPLDRRLPAETEANYYAQTRDDRPVVHT